MYAIDEPFLMRTLGELVRIDSRNPSLIPDGPGEEQIGRYLADLLTALGLEVTIHSLAAGRVNVVGVLRGRGGGRSLMLNAHLDTVGTAGMSDPFAAEIRDGRLYGRGSQDMKGSLAAMVTAVKALVEAGIDLAGDLLLTAVADEEYASIGTQDIVRHYRADAAIVTEPTDLALCRAHRGFIWFAVKTIGRAAHGSRYREGIDANMRMGRFLARLEQLERELRRRPPHPLTGPPSLHAAILRGGSEPSIYAAECRLQLERRTVPGETLERASEELQAILEELAAADETFRATLTPLLERRPFEIGAEAAIVTLTDEVARQYLGRALPHVGASFWTDAAILADAGIDTLLLGPVGAGLHAAEEWVELRSVVDLAHILAGVAARFCK